MSFLADENFPRPAIEALRKAGFDVAWISEGQSGATDEQVLGRSVVEGRTLLTFDKDFGELAFRWGLPA
jgi:predicted nuclease of predicted toxin-antitoxin system